MPLDDLLRLSYPVRMTADLLESDARGFPTPVRDRIEEEMELSE